MPSSNASDPYVLQLQPQRHRGEQRLSYGVVAEQLGLQPRPALLEGDRRADLVHHLDQRWQAGLDRVLGQDPVSEGVQRADRRTVQVVQGLTGALLLLGIGIGEPHRLQLGAQPVAQLCAGLLGESDRCDGGKPDVIDQHQLSYAMHQRSCLARPGAGIDEQRRTGVGADTVARRLVHRVAGHRLPCPSACTAATSGSRSVSRPCSTGSCRLRSQRSRLPP